MIILQDSCDRYVFDPPVFCVYRLVFYDYYSLK